MHILNLMDLPPLSFLLFPPTFYHMQLTTKSDHLYQQYLFSKENTLETKSSARGKQLDTNHYGRLLPSIVRQLLKFETCQSRL
jgi:hypothetical protein